MRRSLRRSIGIVLLMSVAVAGSTDVAAEHSTDVTVNGTVTGVDGEPVSDAVVLVGDSATLTKSSPDELRELAAADPQNLTIIEVTDGRFETTLDSSRAEAAVAVSDGGISELVYIRGTNATLDTKLYERRPQIIHEHAGAVTVDERRAELYVKLGNSGDTVMTNLSVSVASLPDGWSVADIETDGEYRSADRTVRWASIPAGEGIDTTITLAIPTGVSVGEYTVELRAESDTHRVDAASETIEVRPEDTPHPTTGPSPVDEGDGRTTVSTTRTPERPTRGSTTNESGPGLGGGVTIMGLAVLVALLGRRE